MREKKRLVIKGTKPVVVEVIRNRLILLEWDEFGEVFLADASFKQHQPNLKIHVFFNKKLSADAKISQLQTRLSPHFVLHESLTTARDAPWTDLLCFLINFYTQTMITCHHCAKPHPRMLYDITLVTNNRDERYQETKALLRSNETKVKLVDARTRNILSVFDHACAECKLIFASKEAAEKHDRSVHNWNCPNAKCERSRRGNGFFGKRELEQHLQEQQQCEFCPKASFCDTEKFQEHMRAYHVRCECVCAKFYRDMSVFAEHYYARFPLPCLEEPRCEARFRDIDEQAFHHKTEHGSRLPYYCLVCYSESKLTAFTEAQELMKHVTLVQHTPDDFKIVIFPNKN